jgi:hypothetical protein
MSLETLETNLFEFSITPLETNCFETEEKNIMIIKVSVNVYLNFSLLLVG